MNRVGDMMLSIGLFAMFALFGNLDYATVFSASPYVNEIAITIVVILLFIGATAKSAQVPLHVWLPGSMEGSSILKNFFSFYLPLKNEAYTRTCLFIFLIFNLLLLYCISLEFPFFFDLNLACAILLRGPDGKFLSAPFRVYEPLIKDVEEALIGELLGDGCLRYTGKIINGNPNPNKNVIFAMTLKSHEHIIHLWSNTFSSICTNTPPRPWPPEKTGLPASQYAFSSKSLPSLTAIHKE